MAMDALLQLDAAVTIVVGLPGGGKGICLATMLANPGPYIDFTNCELYPAHPRYNEIYRIGASCGIEIYKEAERDVNNPKKILRAAYSDLPSLPYAAVDEKGDHMGGPARIIIDEADLKWDSTEWGGVAKELRHYIKCHRKLQHKIVFCVQDKDNLWNRIRRMCHSYIQCWHDYKVPSMAWNFVPIEASRFIRTEYADQTLSPAVYVRASWDWYGEAQKKFAWYNTRQMDFD